MHVSWCVRVFVCGRAREGGKERSGAKVSALMRDCVCDSRQHDSWQIFQVRDN